MILNDWYNDALAAKTGIRHVTPEKSRAYLDLLQVPTDKSLSLLDVGFGDGSFLYEARKRVDCVGIETDPRCLPVAKQTLGELWAATLVECSLSEMRDYPAKFDYIYLIGRVPTDDEKQVINLLLHTRGQYCIVTGDTVSTGVKLIS